MKNYFKNWNAMRIIRLLIGITAIIQGFYTHSMSIVLLGGFFTLMPLLNIGCCAGTSCQTNKNESNSIHPSGNNEIIYQEVK